jgi:hypothetical protein
MAAFGIGLDAPIAHGAWESFICPAVNVHVGIVSSWRINRSARPTMTSNSEKPKSSERG